MQRRDTLVGDPKQDPPNDAALPSLQRLARPRGAARELTGPETAAGRYLASLSSRTYPHADDGHGRFPALGAYRAGGAKRSRTKPMAQAQSLQWLRQK